MSAPIEYVNTSQGEIDRKLLTVEDVLTEEANRRSIATIWRLDGEVVRRDLHVAILSGQSVFAEQEELS